MRRLGKQQQFDRNFSYLSTLGFVSIYMSTWEYVLISLSTGFTNGGYAGLFWVFIGTIGCYSSIVASLAEMASMAPTTGGQYHWTSEFAPKGYQKILSYASGWMSTLGLIASVSSGMFVMATLLQATIQVINPTFAFTSWSSTLIMLLFLAVSALVNTMSAKFLPPIQTFSLFAHMFGFIIVFVTVWVRCPRNPAADVFLHVINGSGWKDVGIACLISQITVLFCNLGSDSIVHISEEVEEASLVVPRCIWWSYLVNVVVGVLMLVAMLFNIGPLHRVLNADAPYLILFNNTGSTAMALFLTVYLFVLIVSGNVTGLAATSRVLWAFSRDRGLPFSQWISRLEHSHQVPNRPIYLTATLSGVLCFINMGSTFAFQIIISLTMLGFLSTNMLAVGCLLLKRSKGEPLPPARWSLGRYGFAINAFAFLYSGFAIIFACLPATLPVSPRTANWAPLVWVFIMAFATILYVVHGKSSYKPPVELVEIRVPSAVE
ncbi:amino acid transporter [Aaosphaeria arxii CBS 175.79]|uniref:Amino acid transporter n=1 Tax=Aaosphaeria arxii CBS 175.79 TaxID=1450172 RepID=A0A6A5XZH5_9PLEO|nr:amino acid transporter [Aaosphaeria arxii CBS 175.79]KAF2018121.1 amino acid transporter [Aaosphaeria arxii CBS 175.79]